MKNKRNFLVMFSFCLGLFAESYAQSAAHITADIKGLNMGKIVFSYERGNMSYKDSVQADQGVFTKYLALPEAVLCTLSNSVNHQIRILLIDHHPAKITGDVSRFYELKISGSEEHELLNQFKASLYAIPGNRPKATGNQENDKKALMNFAAEQQLLKDSIMSDIVHKYPQHTATAIAVYDMYVTYPNRDKALQNFERLSAEVQKSYYGQRIKMFTNARFVTRIGATATDFSLADKNGRSFSLKNFKGKYVLLDFWASWCVPCRKENPNLINAYQRYKDKGFTIVSLSMDASKINWLNAVEQDKLPWVQLNDPNSTTGKIADTYGVKSLPANFLVDPNGKIVAKNLRGDALEKKLEELIL